MRHRDGENGFLARVPGVAGDVAPDDRPVVGFAFVEPALASIRKPRDVRFNGQCANALRRSPQRHRPLQTRSSRGADVAVSPNQHRIPRIRSLRPAAGGTSIRDRLGHRVSRPKQGQVRRAPLREPTRVARVALGGRLRSTRTSRGVATAPEREENQYQCSDGSSHRDRRRTDPRVQFPSTDPSEQAYRGLVYADVTFAAAREGGARAWLRGRPWNPESSPHLRARPLMAGSGQAGKTRLTLMPMRGSLVRW